MRRDGVSVPCRWSRTERFPSSVAFGAQPRREQGTDDVRRRAPTGNTDILAFGENSVPGRTEPRRRRVGSRRRGRNIVGRPCEDIASSRGGEPGHARPARSPTVPRQGRAPVRGEWPPADPGDEPARVAGGELGGTYGPGPGTVGEDLRRTRPLRPSRPGTYRPSRKGRVHRAGSEGVSWMSSGRGNYRPPSAQNGTAGIGRASCASMFDETPEPIAPE